MIHLLPSGVNESHRIQWNFSNECIIWDHHCYSPKQNLQVVRQFMSTSVTVISNPSTLHHCCWTSLVNLIKCKVESNPGFMVIKMLQVGFKWMSAFSKWNIFAFAAMARWIVRICWATTESTSSSIRLNSSAIMDHSEMSNTQGDWRNDS